MIMFRRLVRDVFGDIRYEIIIEIICKFLCSVFWDFLLFGFWKKFIGKYMVWNVV